ncbi:O-antigen ligase family protein [Roseivirga sp. 4D4]|uniref:O-antigen ligase family protein n=1 Tax=Roseivirga sp. 4D4 TaxID=1889784 RepID=UPI0009F65DF2|nr:O-antigen ligase family protein [Roseivirga sp. 4D4]
MKPQGSNLSYIQPQGASQINTGYGILLLLAILGAAFLLIKILGLAGGMILLALPVGLLVISILWNQPKYGVWATLLMGFLSSGLTRYVPGPWGLSIDILLALCWLVVLMNKQIRVNWKNAKNDLVWISCIWMLYLCLEMVNPSGNGPIAWFYAMRGIGFYQFLTIPLVFLLFREDRDVQKFLNIIIGLSLLGTIWGFKQQIFGVDAAEYYWLYDLDHHEEHVLHGVLRVFSFYSDAGAFGASQAMMALLCGILFMGPSPMMKRIKYLILGLIFFLGFAISGTRGALMVPLAGGIAYLILMKNFKVLASGFAGIVIVFCILKYTFLFQGVEQVRRMRTALDPNNKSMSVRLDNQKIFGQYLANKPFGGGIGTAGFWGARFNPDSLMANTATDSWYVKIWAETGFVGLLLHLMIIGYILGKSGHAIMVMPSSQRKSIAMGFYASFVGIVFASYGNQVLGQMPTGPIMNMMIPFLFILTRKTQS